MRAFLFISLFCGFTLIFAALDDVVHESSPLSCLTDAVLRSDVNAVAEISRIHSKFLRKPNIGLLTRAALQLSDADNFTDFISEPAAQVYFILLNCLENPSEVYGDGYSLLRLAVDSGNSLCVLITIMFVDPDLRSGDGVTALMRAVETGSLKIMNFLIESEAGLDFSDSNGLTALHRATLYPVGDVREEMLTLLINSGVRVQPFDAKYRCLPQLNIDSKLIRIKTRNERSLIFSAVLYSAIVYVLIQVFSKSFSHLLDDLNE